MFAVMKSGGKQFTIKVGDIVDLEKLEVEAGSKHDIKEVLLISNGSVPVIGSPFIKDASISVEVMTHGKAEKVFIFKKKRRKDYRKRQGHRQCYTRVKVLSINSA